MAILFYPVPRVRQGQAGVLAWTAAFILLVAALLPALGMAMREATAGRVTIEICSAQGSRFIELARSDVPAAPVHDSGSAHCPLCMTTGGAGSLPPVAGIPALRVSPAQAPTAPREAPAWPVADFTTPISRAPPALA